MRAFRFAVQAVDASSAQEWCEVARKVEHLGFSTLFAADHYLGPGPAGSATLLVPQQLAPIASMATAAAVTSTLRVGCRVFCVDYHVPAVLAKEAATLDLLSGGRLEFGIGAGWHAAEYEAMGLVFADGPSRVAKLEEAVASPRSSTGFSSSGRGSGSTTSPSRRTRSTASHPSAPGLAAPSRVSFPAGAASHGGYVELDVNVTVQSVANGREGRRSTLRQGSTHPGSLR